MVGNGTLQMRSKYQNETEKHTTPATLQAPASAVRKIGFVFKSISRQATLSTERSSATYVDSAPFCLVYLEKLHREAQFEFNL